MKIGIIGSGTMGNGIAHSFAFNNYKVILCDISKKILDIGISTINNNLNRQHNKGNITKTQILNTLNNISTSISIEKMHDSDIIIEAATEDFDIKSSIFNQLDQIVQKKCILASNTSSISISRIAKSTNRPDRVIGMHFMNPVPIIKLVEVIKTKDTSENTIQIIMDTAIKLKKYPILCLDSPGFVSNRILMPMINEAIYSLMEGVATKEAIDEIMKLGMAHPMGPLTLADLIGLDVCLSILNVLREGFDNPKYDPCPLLIKMCDEGKLGRKPKEGFYKY